MKKFNIKILKSLMNAIKFALRHNVRRGFSLAIFLPVLFGCLGITHTAIANCLDSKRLTGVNLSGAESGADKLPGVAFNDYIYPDIADMRHFQSQGMNTFRLPFLWERIQPVLFGELDAPQLKLIMDTVANARLLDVCIILDVHNYGEYRGQPIGSVAVPPAALVDLWTRLLPSFTDPANVAFDLMNEPSKLPIAAWAATAQDTVNALRKKGSKNLILVAGGSWSGAHAWFADSSGVTNADAFRTFHDAANNYLLETHQYADADYSGTHNTCIDPAILSKLMSNLTEWAISTHQRLFLGEVGVYPTTPCLAALAAIVNGTKSATAWRGWTYWSTGPWLSGYPFTLLPDANGEQPQMAILKQAM